MFYKHFLSFVSLKSYQILIGLYKLAVSTDILIYKGCHYGFHNSGCISVYCPLSYPLKFLGINEPAAKIKVCYAKYFPKKKA